jgi:MFS family permease
MLVATLLVAVGYALFLPFHHTTGQALLNMAVAGVGSGALVAALPAAAAAAAPENRTGFVTGMTNTTKTIGGAIASSIFAIALASTGTIEDPSAGHAPLSGYLVVWSVCALTALVAAGCLLVVPRHAFSDRPDIVAGQPAPRG